MKSKKNSLHLASKTKKAHCAELKYYGYHACLNLWKSRPEDVIRVYVDKKIVKEVAPLLKWCAGQGKAYHLITSEEMCKVSDSVHHEGLCILARESPTSSFADILTTLSQQKKPCCLLFLDGVQNPHNIGSIMRVCAHFGITYILGERKSLPNVSPSAYRVSQGGAEHVHLVLIDNVAQSLEKLKKIGFVSVSTSSHGGVSLYKYHFSPRTLIVMGSESEGVKKSILSSTHDTVMIPGTGWVESLNVSVATGLILGEFWRQQRVTET